MAETGTRAGAKAGNLLIGGVLGLVMLGVPETSIAQAADRWTAGAMDFVRLLDEEKFDSAAARISDAVPADALSPDRLGQIWAQVKAASGPLGDLIPQSITEQNGQHIVDMDARFERQPLKIRVVLDDSLELTGLWFLPPEPPPYDIPAYTDPGAFREVDITVGAEPWTLPGTLTLPVSPGPHPVVVLVHGSGPHDRDETIGPNRPFRDLAGGLATRGVAVLRYEKRTKTHGARMGADVTVDEEVIEDAVAAIEVARGHPRIADDRVVLVGHSLGAMLAPEIAAESGHAAGVVMLAAPARDLADVMVEQLEYVRGTLPEAQRAAVDTALAAARRLAAGDAAPAETVLGAPASYFYDLEARDPVAAARALEVPLLIVQGGRDYQVTMDDFRRWQEALAREANVRLESFADLNHLFMVGEGMATPAEYGQPGFVDARVVDLIAEFVRGR